MISTSIVRDRSGRKRRIAALFLALGLGALSASCIIHSGPSADEVARSGRGVQATVKSGEARFHGEVLEADDDGLTILAVGVGLVSVHWGSVEDLDLEGVDLFWITGFWPDPERIEQVSRVSRFPPGLREPQTRELLDFHGQKQVVMIGHPPAGAPPAGAPPAGAPPAGAPPAGAPPAGAPPAGNPATGHPVSRVAASMSDGEGSDLVKRARTAALRFPTVDEAMLNGYVLVGPDFPGMGHHWVNPFILMRDGTDPDNPPFLTFVETPAGTELTGVALGQVVLAGDDPVVLPHAEAWHDHAGTIDEELLALNPDGGHYVEGDDARLSMLHVWTELDNADGVFAQDNWAIPFQRLGVAPTGPPTPHQGKALFLASGGDEYYLGLISKLVTLAPSEEAALRSVLAEHRALVQGMIDRQELTRLGDVWPSLWDGIRGGVSSQKWEAIRVLGG